MIKVTFKYDREKDIWCLLNKGKSSNNSPKPTKVYEKLVDRYGENPSENETFQFIDDCLDENNINIQEHIDKYQKDWNEIANAYHEKAEVIFGVQLPENISVYLTINNRSPYNIKENYFYSFTPSLSAKKIAIHELWHFYTWYGLGEEEEEKLGKQKYNDIKEALTVLLNIEFKYLLPEGVIDEGYPQHQELREKILNYWEKDKDMRKLWDICVAEVS